MVGRVEDGWLLLDLRAVPPADDDALIAAVLAATGLAATGLAGTGLAGIQGKHGTTGEHGVSEIKGAARLRDVTATRRAR